MKIEKKKICKQILVGRGAAATAQVFFVISKDIMKWFIVGTNMQMNKKKKFLESLK